MTYTLLDMTLAEDASQALHIAQRLATEYTHQTFGAAHLLKALLHKDIGLIPLLKQYDKDYYYLEDWAEVRMESYPKGRQTSEPPSDDSIAGILNEADDIRIKIQRDKVDALCLLTALCTPGVGFTFEQLKSLPLTRTELLEASGTEVIAAPETPASGSSVASGKKTTSALAAYCLDKTEQVRMGKADEIVGRDQELRMMAEILCRRSKPNVLLVGEPGVGKSALADGFAYAVLQKNVPDSLLNARIFELNNGALIAGASYKGEIEDRLKKILTELKQFEKAILFVDEIHTLLDKQSGASGAANLLKPELARGEITLIGVTTQEEYKKHIESDEAFNRRFERLLVEEPDATVAYQMLKKVIPYYEQHHHIQTTDEVLHESIRLAKRYIKDKKLPDSAIDLLDRTLAALRLLNDTGIREIERTEQQIDAWNTDETDGTPHSLDEWKWMCRQFQHKLSPIVLGQLSSETDPQELENKAELQAYLQATVQELRQLSLEKRTELQKTDVAAIIANKTGIPIGKIQTQERERLLSIESILRQRVVGQDQAIKAVADAILESRSGLSKAGQPIASFFFLGPTGTGKTELAKSLAEFLFQDESFMIRFDMSEFKEEHSAALLYGAPPGYVGYEEGGLLVNKIRKQPYAIVLFDEIEKAHPSVFDVFLQIMDEGRLHDKLGKEGDFSNAVVIFTSNIGSQYVVEQFQQGKIPASTQLLDIMGNYFRPEFLGRLTELVPFAPMKQEVVRGILDIQLKSLYAALDKQGIALTITPEAKDWLALQGFTPAYGARPLGGVIRNQLRRPLSRKIISGDLLPGSQVQLHLEEDQLVWIHPNQNGSNV